MKLFKSLFRGANKTATPTEAQSNENVVQLYKAKKNINKTAPGTHIYYHPELIDKLEDDHRELLLLFSDIVRNFEENKYVLVRRLLVTFKSKTNEHFLIENIKLYVYLRNVLKNDRDNKKIMRYFQKEISEISRVLTKFLDKYVCCEWSISNIKSFKNDIKIIGNALTKRIQKEEAVLYPLYMPPESYE